MSTTLVNVDMITPPYTSSVSCRVNKHVSVGVQSVLELSNILELSIY